jgi:DNA-binding NarL/FixJ family response regulator
VRLTPREIQVLTLVAQGNAYAHIAHQLSISEDTAKVHIEKARWKLGAKNRTHAAVIAVMKGILKF